MKVVASGAAYQVRAVDAIVRKARVEGRKRAEFVVPDRKSADLVLETYGRDAVKVTRSTAHKLSIKI